MPVETLPALRNANGFWPAPPKPGIAGGGCSEKPPVAGKEKGEGAAAGGAAGGGADAANSDGAAGAIGAGGAAPGGGAALTVAPLATSAKSSCETSGRLRERNV